jgi:hypothetical protein
MKRHQQVLDCIANSKKQATNSITYHGATKKQLVLQEHLMIVTSPICSSSKSPKAIQVELPLKRSQLRLTKVLGHNLIDELSRLVNHKATPVRLPRTYTKDICQMISPGNRT